MHERLQVSEGLGVGVQAALCEPLTIRRQWIIRRYASEADFRQGKELAPPSIIDGNVILDEGAPEFWKLIGGIAATAFSNANARLGVGDSTTAEAAAQTGLQAATNKLYKAMEAGFPSVSGRTITWRAIFGGTEANFAWQEFTVASGADDTAVNLNRKVSNQGTKASGQVWTLDFQMSV